METENQRLELEIRDNDSGEKFGGIANRGFSGTWIQSGLQWKLSRMNQTEIDELLRDPNEHGDTEEGRPSDYNQWGTMEMNEEDPSEHGYMETARSSDYSGYGSMDVHESEGL